jgi:predicted aldo/keto reductase-like oxidoreductase
VLTKLGKTDLSIYPLGFGGIPIQRISFEKAKTVILKAKELGINFIDTAQGYSDSEEKIGFAINEDKNYWVLASKSPARDSKEMEKAVTNCLKHFRRDFIDLYQLHLISSIDELQLVLGKNGAMETLLKYKEKGYIKYIGITGHKPQVLKEALDIFPFDTVQAPYNPLETQSEELLKYASLKGVGTIIMKPFAGGALTSPSGCIKYILSKDFVDVVIPGMERVEQVEENFRASLDLKITEEEKMGILQDIHQLKNNFCRRCDYCQPCPQGIKISTVFILHGYLSRYGLKDWATSRYQSLPIPANKCTNCGVCERKCPYELPIRQMLQKSHNDFQK